ncbi:Vesicle trafficking 1 [Carabus blaptoides fortunei]
MGFPPCPESLKAIAHYLKVAEEHDNRDIVISYWCRLHALEVAMKITNTKAPEVSKMLISLMDWLEATKGTQSNNDGITSKMCAQATVENYALKLFKYADEQDRAENYGKNVVKAFYTAGILMDVLTSFGELSEDIAEKRKYAKWKAAYIHNCLKAGEQPVSGPMANSDENDDDFTPVNNSSNADSVPSNEGPIDSYTGGPGWNNFPSEPTPPPSFPGVSPPTLPSVSAQVVPTTPFVPTPAPAPAVVPTPTMTFPTTTTATLDAEQISKAQKYCKWALSALNYDDIKSAIENLQKALYLLQMGKESPE